MSRPLAYHVQCVGVCFYLLSIYHFNNLFGCLFIILFHYSIGYAFFFAVLLFIYFDMLLLLLLLIWLYFYLFYFIIIYIFCCFFKFIYFPSVFLSFWLKAYGTACCVVAFYSEIRCVYLDLNRTNQTEKEKVIKIIGEFCLSSFGFSTHSSYNRPSQM